MKKIRYLITGSGGTIGSALLDKLMSKNNVTVCAFDSDEERLFNISEKYSTSRNNLHLFLGNIRDKQRLLLAMENIDVVFHCAALKHVYINEYNPFEVKKTNIDGVENIIDCAIEHKVNKVIFTSSDKAVNPINIMGASKMMGERLFISANNRVGMGPTIFSCVRFGNVIDSSGSVLQTFRKQINNNIPLTITDKRMTRFIITLNNAIDLCFYAERNMKGGEIFIKNMGSINITDLAIAFSKKSNPSIKYIGIKEGEKLYEELLTAEEASRAYVHEGFICILPELINKSLSIKQKKKFQDIAKNRLKFTKELRSDQKLLSLTNIRNLLSSCYAKKKNS